MAHPFTIGLDLGDRTSRLCILDPAGEVTEEGRIRPPLAHFGFASRRCRPRGSSSRSAPTPPGQAACSPSSATT